MCGISIDIAGLSHRCKWLDWAAEWEASRACSCRTPCVSALSPKVVKNGRGKRQLSSHSSRNRLALGCEMHVRYRLCSWCEAG
jgi:hypothetical protein